jgi:nitrogen-specific signal transduction histidine kinase
MAVLHFKDSGPGIHVDLKQSIFRRGMTSGQPGGGRGLAIVRDVVWAHWGTIEEVGVQGVCAHFIVRIPAREHGAASRSAAAG